MGTILVSLGAILALIGWVWLIFTGFTKAGALWGILAIFFSWIAGLGMYFTKKVGLTPTLVALAGAALIVIGQLIGN
jgi:hypothetical protein